MALYWNQRSQPKELPSHQEAMNDAKLQAREGEWYDDFYQAIQIMGPWYYFMIRI